MKKDDILYGLEHQERLSTSIDEVLEDFLQGAGLDSIDWPIRILVHRRMDVSHFKDIIARGALEDALERIDEEHGDPDGDPAEPTPEMVKAAEAFAAAVVDGYVPWACEPTGEVIEYTREQVLALKVTL